MKIIYIANSRIPTEKAHGHQIMKMCETFSALGADLELVVPRRVSRDFSGKNPFAYYGIKENFVIRKLNIIDPYWLMRFPGGIYLKVQAAFFMIGLFFYFLFKRGRKDCVIYTRDEHLLPLLLFFSSQVVWEAHALPRNKNYYLSSWRKCSLLVCLTKQMKNDLAELGITEDKIHVSPDAVDLDVFGIEISPEEARKKVGLPIDRIILGYTGSFKTKGMDKGIKDIIGALKIIGGKNILFVAVGGNEDDLAEYGRLAAAAGVAGQVKLLSKVEQKQLAVFQQAFDMLLMPFPRTRHYLYYMSPLKMFEYMAAKRPIIASDLPTIREVLDEANCIFVRPDDPADLAEKISAVAANPGEFEKNSQEAYNKVEDYTWEKRAQDILNLLK